METIRIIFFTEQGGHLAGRMADVLEVKNQVRLYTTKKDFAWGKASDRKVDVVAEGLQQWCAAVFSDSKALIFIGACGIAVRTVAPFLVSKLQDPAVLAADEKGIHIISLLSGHIGGGNALTLELAEKLGAEAVITTASDVNQKLAIDLWAQKNRLFISDMKQAKEVAADLVGGCQIPFYCAGKIVGKIPPELRQTARAQEAAVVISVQEMESLDVLHLIPKAVVLGIGCKRGKTASEIRTQVFAALKAHGIALQSIEKMVSIDLKAQESGLLALAKELNIPFQTYSAAELEKVPGDFSASGFVRNITGVDNVCERAAVAALPKDEQKQADFICRKTAAEGVTIALVCREWSVEFE